MTPSYRFRPRVEDVTARLGPACEDAGELLARLAARRGKVALDSAGGRPRRWSWVAFDPLDAPRARGLGDLRGLVASLAASATAVPGPFAGGFLGAFAYDLGVPGEAALALPADPWRSPGVLGGLFVDFVVVDHVERRAYLVLGDEPGDGRPPLAERRAELHELLGRPAPLAAGDAPRALGPLVRHTPAAEHMRRIEAARASIAAGDYYQANLAHRFTRRVAGSAVALYRSLRRANPAPYMAFVEDGPWTLCSASPELLLESDGRTARTRPIKGTRARCAEPAADERAAEELLASEKDRAELAMIVDLERNDLGRVARPGSVRVDAFPRLESYATVHHLVADVSCALRDDADALDALLALFPGGSITGAPKLASMRAIAALEGEGRGFFTGSAGFLDTRGRAAFNILIRTLVRREPERDADPGERGLPERVADVSFHVGGGITWSSSAAAEDQETLVKGAALAAALDATEAGPTPEPKTAQVTTR